MGTTTPYAKLHITQGNTTAAECIPLKICSGSHVGNTIGVPNGTSTFLVLGTECTSSCKAGIGHCRTSDFANIWDIGDIVFCINSALNATEVNSTHEKMRIKYNGIVLINNTNVDNNTAKLLVSGSDDNYCSALFYHPNLSQGIGITYDGLRALGFNTNQDIVMRPRGSGMFIVDFS